MRALVTATAARLSPVVGASWHVYAHAVPERPTYPYLWVYANTGQADTDDFTEAQARRDVTLWVTSVAANDDPASAASQAAWGSEKAQISLIGWRPSLGAQSWRAQQLASQPPTRDNDLPDRVVFASTDTYGITIQPA